MNTSRTDIAYAKRPTGPLTRRDAVSCMISLGRRTDLDLSTTMLYLLYRPVLAVVYVSAIGRRNGGRSTTVVVIFTLLVVCDFIDMTNLHARKQNLR